LSKDARELHDQESAELAVQIKDLRQQLGGWETQITTLLDWKERMDLCLNRLQQADADSSESRNAKEEILMALGALRQIMERLQTTKTESAGTPSRQAAAEGSATSRTGNGPSAMSSSEAKTGSALLSEIRPNTRLSRLREELQREESRLNFLRQNTRSLELRARTRPTIPSAQEGQEGLSQWEERIKRAAVDETNLLEKIAALKGQIAELRGEGQTTSAVPMETSG
jgi:hypothetical protein